MNPDLGRLELLPARSVWANEASNFTPWLAVPENIASLGEALGLELEVENIEVQVGPFSADILARDTGSSEYVVIENQLERMNHDHLGKALTYGAVLDASAVVWIATNFTDEHKRAIDWLNDKGGGDVAFYAVQLEVWRIGASKPAVRFNVVSRPAQAITALQAKKAAAGISPTRQLQLEWWTFFRERLAARRVVPSVQTPRPQYWFDVALGRSGFHLSCIADTYANRVGVRLYLAGRSGGASALELLRAEKATIEREIGHPVEWNPNAANADKTIVSARPADLSDRSAWPEYAEWLVDEVELFRNVFRDRILTMEFSVGSTESSMDPDSNSTP